jgi:hypothetical protein
MISRSTNIKAALRARQRGFFMNPYRFGSPPKTSALLHFDGSDGSTAITDETGKPWTAVDGAALSTAWAKYGSASLLLGGIKSLSTPSSADFDFGAGDFTIAFWINLLTNTGSDYRALICKDNINVLRGWLAILGIAGDGGNGCVSFSAFVGTTTHTVSDPSPVVTNTPTFFAIGRDNGFLRLYRNGAQVASTAMSGSINAPNIPAYMGALIINGTKGSGSNSPDGYMDEMLIKKEALYPNGDAFTPPSTPFSL